MSNILKDAIKLNLMRSPLGHKGVKVLIKGKEWHINESLKYENGGLSVFFVCVGGAGGVTVITRWDVLVVKETWNLPNYKTSNIEIAVKNTLSQLSLTLLYLGNSFPPSPFPRGVTWLAYRSWSNITSPGAILLMSAVVVVECGCCCITLWCVRAYALQTLYKKLINEINYFCFYLAWSWLVVRCLLLTWHAFAWGIK